MKTTLLNSSLFTPIKEYIWGDGRPNAFNVSTLSVAGTYNTTTREFIAAKRCDVVFSANMRNYSSNDNGMVVKLNGTTVSIANSQSQGLTDKSNARIFWTGVMEPGDILSNSDIGALGGASWSGWSLKVTVEPVDL